MTPNTIPLPEMANDARGMAEELFRKMPPPGSVVPQDPRPAAELETPPPAPATPAPAPAAPLPTQAAPAAPPVPLSAQLSDRFSKTPTPPANPAAPTAPAAEPPETLPTNADGKPDPRAAHAYAALRSENSRFKREVVPALEAAKRDAEAKLNTFLEENQKLKQELEAREEKIGRLSLTESPQFQQKYGTREAGIRTKLSKALVTFAKVDPAKAEEFAGQLLVLGSNPEKLAQATEEMNPAVAGAAMLAAQEWAQLDEERKQEVSNWRQSALAQGTAEARESVVRSVEERRALADAAIQFARDGGNPALNPDFNSEESVALAAEIEAGFRGFVQTATEDQLVKAAADGYSAPLLFREIDTQRAKIEELEARLQGYQRAAGVPVVPWRVNTQPPPPPPAPPPPNVVSAESDDDPATFAKTVAANVLSGWQRDTSPRQL